MVVTILWWTIRVGVTMDSKRTPVRHLVVMIFILTLVILAYFYISGSPSPSTLQPATNIIARHKFEQLIRSTIESSNPTRTKMPSDPLVSMQEVNEIYQRSVSHGMRPERCAKCFKPDIEPLIGARYLCRPTEIAGTVDIVTLIFSHVSNRSRRDAIRQSWAMPTKQNTAILRHIFVIGLSQEPETNMAVQLENKQYLDILQLDFLESYNNLTLKTIGALKWAADRCPHASHVVKTDDDMWLNLQRLLWVLPRYDLTNAVGGYCVKDAKPVRDLKSKWYVSFKSFPGNTYPPFCSGTGYVLQMQTVKDILKISPNVPYYKLEDVYIGLCLQQLGYSTQTLPGFHNTFVHFDPCTYRKTVVTSHNVNDELLHWAWNSECAVHPFITENT